MYFRHCTPDDEVINLCFLFGETLPCNFQFFWYCLLIRLPYSNVDKSLTEGMTLSVQCSNYILLTLFSYLLFAVGSPLKRNVKMKNCTSCNYC
jgi:hypothetical protein